MALKVYISGMSGNKEVKKRQQRVLMILDSKNIKYEVIDITEPGKENEKDIMQTKSTSNGATVSDPNPRHPLPPQLFNENEYCGDYDAFDLANEIDTLEEFLKIAPAERMSISSAQIELKKENGENGEAEKAPEENSAAGAEANKENESSTGDGHGDGGDVKKDDANNESIEDVVNNEIKNHSQNEDIATPSLGDDGENNKDNEETLKNDAGPPGTTAEEGEIIENVTSDDSTNITGKDVVVVDADQVSNQVIDLPSVNESKVGGDPDNTETVKNKATEGSEIDDTKEDENKVNKENEENIADEGEEDHEEVLNDKIYDASKEIEDKKESEETIECKNDEPMLLTASIALEAEVPTSDKINEAKADSVENKDD